jgi:DNA primase
VKLERHILEQLVSNTFLSQDGLDLYGTCPFCGQNEFGISLGENHPYSCFRKKACGATGNIYSLLRHLGKIKEFIGERQIDVDGEFPSLAKEDVEIVDEPLLVIQPPVGWRRVYEDAYLTSRGFTAEQFEKFKVGRSVFKRDYVTLLIEMHGQVVGYISRSVKSKEWIDNHNATSDQHHLRYQNSVSDFSRMLFGYDEIEELTTQVILVEGPFSKTMVDSNLSIDYQPFIKCCATFGAKVSDHQIKLLKDKGITMIWLWFEADVLEKIKTIAAKLALHFEVRCAFISGKDPGDMNMVETFDLFEKSVSYLELSTNFMA